MKAPRWSVVVSCYREEQSIDEFLGRLVAVLDGTGLDAEIVAVDDGSDDATFARLEALFHRHPRVHAVVELFRNAGQAEGLTAGIVEATGEHVVLMDSDLQLDPEDLPALLAAFEQGHDVVSGYRAQRRDPWPRRIASALANAVVRRAGRTALRDMGCTFKVYDGRLVRAFELGPHKVLRQLDLIAAAGRIAEVPVAHHPRKYGRSGWSLARLLDLNTTNLLDLTHRAFQYLAVGAALGSALLVARVVVDWWIPMAFLPEVTNGLLLNAIAIALLVTTSIQALMGELILRSFTKLRARPAYVVRRTLRRGDRQAAGGVPEAAEGSS